MKRLLLFCIVFLTLASLSSKERVIERPPFSVRNYGTLEIEKIVLNDKATVMHFTGYQQPGWWFRIDTGTYIIANGRKYLVESADGLNLDEETYPDETGKRPFTLTFGAIDPNTERIDFIESDCDNCFKIWGIELNSDILTNRIPVPEKIKRLATMKVEGALEPFGFKNGIAQLKGQILGYVPDLKIKGEAYVNNPLTGNQEEYNFAIAEDGTFEAQIPMVTTMQVFVGFSGLFWNTILLSPGEDTFVYFDLQQKSCQESKARKDKCEDGKWIYFGGAYADINNYIFDNNLTAMAQQHFNNEEMRKEIFDMTSYQYRDYILARENKAQEALREKNVPQKIQQFMEIEIRMRAMYYLMMGDYFLESAYRTKKGIERPEPIPEYNKPEFDTGYYQFLKYMDLNNPLNLYCNEYSGSVRSCSFISSGSRRVFLHNLSDIVEQLIRITDMTPEELVYAEYLITQKYENWPADKVEREKQTIKKQLDKIMQSENITNEVKQQINRIDNLISNNEASYREIHNLYINLIFGNQGLHVPSDPDESAANGDVMQDEEEKDFTPDFITAFTEKYKEHTDMLFSESFKKDARDILAANIGEDQGLCFNLMRMQDYSSSLEEMVPVSSPKMTQVQQMDDPFFYEYLSAKNAEILAKIEENKTKGGYNVYATPETENDKLLFEILKPYKGKVIFIDFWNTWCGPCRSAMKIFEPTKQEYKEKDVVFIYLADESSPLKAWENMIPDIPGEHYRLKEDEMSYLKKKYGVRGIPSYLILDKNGEQVYFQVGFPGNQIITEILDRELAK